MAVSREEFVQWKESGIYQELLRELQEAMSDITLEIITRPSSNPERDQYLKGILKGIDMVGSWTPEFEKESDNA